MEGEREKEEKEKHLHEEEDNALMKTEVDNVSTVVLHRRPNASLQELLDHCH